MAKGNKKTGTQSNAGRGGGRGRGRGRGRGGRGGSGSQGNDPKSPGILKAIDKAKKKYGQKKAEKASARESKKLVDILLPQQVEMQIQTMLMSRAL